MMKGPRKVVSGVLNSIDIFEDPIHLNMGGETAMTSSLGGFASLLIIIFLGVQAIIQTVGMFNRDDPQIIQMNEYEDDPGAAYLNQSNNFVMAIAITKNNANVDMTAGSPVSFTSTYSQYIRSEDGSQTKHKSQIYWAPCTEDNFPSTIFPDGTFTTYSLSYAFCPTKINFTDSTTGTCADVIKQKYPNCQAPPNFDITGTYLSLDFEFIQFKLKTCSQSDSQYITGLQCTTDDIDTIFDNSEITMNLYYSNNLIDPVNYQTPNKTYLDTLYWNVNPSVSTVADIFVDTETVQDYNNYFLSDSHNNRTFYSIQKETTRELQKFQATSLLEWNLRRSNLNHITQRTYTRILDVISNVGGMSELFIILGALIAGGYIKYKYQMILSNELYDFEPDDSQKPVLELPKVPYGSPLIDLTSQTRTENSMVSRSSKRKTFSQMFSPKKKTSAYKISSVKKFFETQKKKKRILNYSEFSYLKSILRALCCRTDPEEEIAKKARKQVIQDLDIVKVVEKLKEIDKLKMLLLNSNQRKAFEFIEKPLITHKNEMPIQAGSVQRLEGYMGGVFAGAVSNLINPTQTNDDSISEYAKVYMAYRGLQEDPEVDNFRYNSKLLNMISEDLRNVFQQIDQFMGPVPDPKKFDEIVRKVIQPKDLRTTTEEAFLNDP